MTDEQWFGLYCVVSLLIWLYFEMSGQMAKSRKNSIDGTSKEFIIITLWGLFIIIGCMAAFAMAMGWLFNKASEIGLKKE